MTACKPVRAEADPLYNALFLLLTRIRMFRLMLLITATALLMVIGGCAKGNDRQKIEDVVLSPDCIFPDTEGENAPAWVCGEPVEGLEVSTVGIAERTSAGISYQRQMAESDARVRLASQLSTRVQSLVKQYVATTGSGDDETVDRVSSSVSRQLTDLRLVGSRFFTSRVSSNGTLYVLFGLDKQLVDRHLEESMLNSLQNDRVVWQKMQADKADDELVEAILNQ